MFTSNLRITYNIHKLYILALLLQFVEYAALLVSSGTSSNHNIVYQNEEGQWVTDLAYYSSFEKEVDGKTSENSDQFETEDFIPSSMSKSKTVPIMMSVIIPPPLLTSMSLSLQVMLWKRSRKIKRSLKGSISLCRSAESVFISVDKGF